MFVDEASIYVRSGCGGNGIIHFHKEKYINRGGPDGGDGGKGGDIVFRVNPHVDTLSAFRHNRKFVASDGKRGGPNNQTGKSAEDLYISVPAGTLLYENSSGKFIGDLTKTNQELLVCKGGRGGRGNAKFANSRNQAPRIAEKGEPGQELWVRLELRLIADLGIIGMPNAGKSSILAAVSNATPKIANYPFTTIIPNLGVVQLDETTPIILADIPGLIEGAHTGAGLGDSFLKHIQRTKALIHVLDGLSNDPLADYAQINTELSLFDPQLEKKPQFIVFNKIDLPEVSEKLEIVKKTFNMKGKSILPVSAVTHENLQEMLAKANELLQSLPERDRKEKLLPIYSPGEDNKDFKIIRLRDGWRIMGTAIERAAEMTYWEYFQSVRRFHRILAALKIENALREEGIKEGDIVRIGNHELIWTEEIGEV